MGSGFWVTVWILCKRARTRAIIPIVTCKTRKILVSSNLLKVLVLEKVVIDVFVDYASSVANTTMPPISLLMMFN